MLFNLPCKQKKNFQVTLTQAKLGALFFNVILIISGSYFSFVVIVFNVFVNIPLVINF